MVASVPETRPLSSPTSDVSARFYGMHDRIATTGPRHLQQEHAIYCKASLPQTEARKPTKPCKAVNSPSSMVSRDTMTPFTIPSLSQKI